MFVCPSQWKMAALVYSRSHECTYLTEAIKDVFSACDVTIVKELSSDNDTVDDKTAEAWMRTLQITARSKQIFIVYGSDLSVGVATREVGVPGPRYLDWARGWDSCKAIG